MSLLFALLCADAHAFLIGGNPDVVFHVDRSAHDLVGGSVTLSKLRVYTCDGAWTDYPVGASIDPVAGSSVSIAGGDLCALRFYWSTAMEIDGDGSLGQFTLSYAESTTQVPLDPDVAVVPLTPFELVSGAMTSGAPRLVVDPL